jgi:DNA replication protein DnaC
MGRRYERGSILVTSNRSVGEWGTVLNELNTACCPSG